MAVLISVTEGDVTQIVLADVGVQGAAGAASSVATSFTPYGNIAATNVQTAIQELDDEKFGKAGGTVTGSVVTTGVNSAAAGSAAAPSITFTGDLDTGIYSPGANQVAISTNGTGRLFVDSAGNVGLGTSSPARLLHVSGSGTQAIRLENTLGTGTVNLELKLTNNTFTTSLNNTSIFYNDTAGREYIWYQNSAERMRLDTSGQLGIGTSAPSALLHVKSTNPQVIVDSPDASTESRVRFYKNGSSVGQVSSLSGNLNILSESALTFSVNGGSPAEAARIDSSGRLLVGTSTVRNAGNASQSTRSPLYFIEAAGASAFSIFTGILGRADSNGPNITLAKTRSNSTGDNTIVQNNDILGQIAFAGADGSTLTSLGATIEAQVDGTPGTNDMPGRLVFSVTADGAASPTEAMRINNAGELLVGYTTDNGAYKLQVNSQIFATSATIATSDGRYKENVASLGGCLDLVKALRPVSFTWKPQEDITRIDDEGNEVLVREGHNFPEGTQVGFIAQEVQEVLDGKPWLSSVIKENVRPAVNDNDGNELAPEEQFYGIAEGNLIAVLTNALQEAVGRIEALEAEVAALKA